MGELTIKDKVEEVLRKNFNETVDRALEQHDERIVEFAGRSKVIREQSTDEIMQLIDSAITEAQQDRIKRNKSFCGCPMCTHHSEPYEAQLKNNTTKQEDIKDE